MTQATNAHQLGFFIESIAIVDALISDRLESICSYSGFLEVKRMPIGAIRSRLEQQNVRLRDDALLRDLASWVPDRNLVIHGLVKPEFHDARHTWEARVEFAADVSAVGLKLMKRVFAEAKWHKH